MTDRQPWGPDDDELVRRALASLRDDIDAAPLPEPEQVRRFAEGGGSVTDITRRRRSQRLVGTLAGVAAAGLVAAGAGFLTWNSSDVAPPATSSTFGDDTTSTSSTSTPTSTEDLVMLGAREWSGALGHPVPTTVTPTEQAGPCFTPGEDASWEHREARGSDGTTVAREWIGTDREAPERMRESVETSLADCADLDPREVGSGALADGEHRIWRSAADPDQWWIEVRRGDQLALLAVSARGTDRTNEDLRRIGLGVLGRMDLAALAEEPTDTSDDPTSTATDDGPDSPEPTSTGTPAPTSTATPPPSSDPTDSPAADEGSDASGDEGGEGPGGDTPTSDTPEPETSSPDPAETTPPPDGSSDPDEPGDTPSEGEHPEVGFLPDRYFVDAADWASPALTGGEASYEGPVEMEGRSYFTQCTSTDGGDRVGAIGIRSGSGEMNYFGRQYVLLTDEADARHDELLTNLGSGSCLDAPVTSLGNGLYKVGEGDFVEYLGVARISDGVTILHLTEATTAPGPLTDDVARTEMDRLLGLASGH